MKVLAFACYPLKLRDHSPLPRGFLPKIGRSQKGKTFLYPNEDEQLMGCTLVPLWRRILWGVLAREGMREGELVGLTWSCVDLERGVLTLDENKTDDPRAWAASRRPVP
jgi:integrase